MYNPVSACPNCKNLHIVVIFDKGRNVVYPSCGSCRHVEDTPNLIECLEIDLTLNYHLKGQDLIDETYAVWEEYLSMMRDT